MVNLVPRESSLKSGFEASLPMILLAVVGGVGVVGVVGGVGRDGVVGVVGVIGGLGMGWLEGWGS